MKKILTLLFSLYIFSIAANAATIMWVGPATGNWNTTSNWSTGTVPLAGDDVVFNTSVSVEMDIIPSAAPFIYTINSLRVTGNAIVVLIRTQAGGGSRVLQLRSTNAVNPGLKIEAGSSLTLNAVNTMGGSLNYSLDLTGAAGVTGEIAGSLHFTGTGSGVAAAQLSLYTDLMHFANLTVSNTGSIRYYPNSGNTQSSGSGNYLVMQDGSTYEINKNGGSVPHGNWADNSTILISGALTSSVSFSQSNYGNMEWNSPAMTAAIQLFNAVSPPPSNTVSFHNLKITNTNTRELRLKTGGGASINDFTVRGDLEIGPDAIVVFSTATVTSANGARLHLKGNMNNRGTIKTDGTAGTVNELELSGSSNQHITNTGIVAGAHLSVIMNNAAGATLLSPLTLPANASSALQLNNGIIKTTAAFILIMPRNGNYSGASSNSFIDGPMRKTGDDPSFVFPVGKGTIYAPVTFHSDGLAVTDEFEAEYFRQNPQNVYGTAYEAPLDHISYVEYWRLEKSTGSTATPVTVTLAIHPYSFAKVLNTTLLARYDPGGAQWKDGGITTRQAGIPVSPYITGNITSSPQLQLGVFTLATTDQRPVNPLPLRLVSFEVAGLNAIKTTIKWELADYPAEGSDFELQHSPDGKHFSTIAIIKAINGRLAYSAKDENRPAGTSWYRLKIAEPAGYVSYSKSILVKKDKITSFAIFPNPVRNEAIARIIMEADTEATFLLYNAAGKKIWQWKNFLVRGINTAPVKTAELKPGLYFLQVEGAEKNSVMRFVKL